MFSVCAYFFLLLLLLSHFTSLKKAYLFADCFAVLHYNKTWMHNGINSFDESEKVNIDVEKSLLRFGVYFCNMFDVFIKHSIKCWWMAKKKTCRYTIMDRFFSVLFHSMKIVFTWILELHIVRSIYFNQFDKLINSILIWHRW